MQILFGAATTVVAFLVTLTIVVFVHEFGHFLVARWNGIKVEVFSIGFGKELWGFNDRYGTRWRLSALPLGGYVKFLGDVDAASARTDESGLSEEEKRHTFANKSRAQKAAVIFAGPAANFIFAFLVFAGLLGVFGQPLTQAIIGEVVPGGPAEMAGMKAGDRIVSVAGRSVDRFEDVQSLVMIFGAEAMEITVEREGTSLVVRTAPQFHDVKDPLGNPQRVPFLGVVAGRAQTQYVRLGPLEALSGALERTFDVTYGTLVSLGQMISGARGTEDLGGPIRIAQYSGQVAQLGIASFIGFVALLSANLGLINLFPIPLLDGGHLLFYFIEAIIGRPLNERVRDVGLKLGLAIVFGIMVFATWNDVVRLIAG